MSHYDPAPDLQLPPMTAEEAHQAYGISKSMLDTICTIMHLNPHDAGAYGIAAFTFHHELFDLFSRADVYINNTHGLIPMQYAQSPEEVDWHPIHQRMQEAGLEVLGISLFEKIHRVRQFEQRVAPVGTPRPTDQSIGLMILETISVANFLKLDAPTLPNLSQLRSSEHEGHATERDGKGRTGGQS